MGKLIVIMVDGVSADFFEKMRHQLPTLNRLAKQGTQVEGVSPEMCGTSCPGRTSMVTAAAPSEHGVYGNFIVDGDTFRWANPYDVKSETLPELATKQGKDVACIGFGMVRPEDCSTYIGPWWADEMLMGGKDAEPLPADKQWQHCGKTFDPEGRIDALYQSGQAKEPVRPNYQAQFKLQLGMLADHQLLDIAAGLAISEQAPDLILLEVAITDYYLHKYGEDHPLTEWSMRVADAQIGSLITRLEQAGKLDEYNFAIMSDHGHAPMPDAFYVDRVLDKETVWSSEGAVLMVKPRDKQHAHEVTIGLSEFGIQLWDNNHLPEDLRDDVITFITPKGSDISFEAAPADAPEGHTGPSKYISNHGMRPGRWEDYRFCIFSGPDVPKQILPTAYNYQVAPTLASIMGIETPWHAQPIFKRND